MFGLFDHFIDETLFCLLAGHPRDLFKLPSRFIDSPVTFSSFFLDIFFSPFERSLSSRQLAFSSIEGLGALVDAFFFADQPPLLILLLTAGFA